jgi:RsiW-degrading membrane proteinase PrsW (M82 family)
MVERSADVGLAGQPNRGRAWWRVLLTALVLYFVGIFILILTANPNLFPTVVMLGSFMVPAAYVVFFYERRHLSNLSIVNTAQGFFYGGVLGVFAASLLEPLFVGGSGDLFTFFQVGIVEEFVKILGVLLIARRLRHDSELDGLILGAAAGMGFAALESTGYAFTAFLQSGGSLSVTVGVTLLRGILSPVGHGTWTAILAGVLFRESRSGRYRLTRSVIVAYLTVVVLHGLWDGLPGFLSNFVSSGPDLFLAQTLVGLAGLFILWLRWREGRRLQAAQVLVVAAQPAQQAEAATEHTDGSPTGGEPESR